MFDPDAPPVTHRVRAFKRRRVAAADDAAFYLLALLGAYGAFYATLILLHPFSERAFVTISDLGSIPPPVLAGLLALWAATRSEDHVRTGWFLIGAGCLFWAAGETAWFVYDAVLEQDPFPSIADAGYLTMLPLVAVGLVYLTSEGRKLLHCQPAVDGIALTLALASFVWLFALEPTYSDSASSALEKVIGAAYPVGDLALCFALAVAVQRRWERHDSLVLCTLLAGMLLLVASDVGFAYESLQGTYTATSFENIGWPFAFLGIAAAAGMSALWLPSYTTPRDLPQPKPWRIALPIALLLPQLGLVGWSFSEKSLAATVPLTAITVVAILAVAASVAISFGVLRELEKSRDTAVEWLERFVQRKAA